MAKLYKGTKSAEVPHAVDIKEWEKEGWSQDDPKGKVLAKKTIPAKTKSKIE